MSDLGAIFHVKKDGVQYDAHAYTTLGECPEPNLKLMYKGQQGYVKLEAKGEGDVPCYVKAKIENKVYQVKKEAVPTGECKITQYQTYTFVVPAGVKVIEVEEYIDSSEKYSYVYVGVTPGSTHDLHWGSGNRRGLRCISHNIVWSHRSVFTGMLRWSPEINKHSVTVSDYN